MKSYSRSHLSDPELLRVAGIRNGEIHAQTADQLADIAEIDTRQLFRQFAHPSMTEFCVVEWDLSEDAAQRRIHAARTARRFPAIFEALADGRLHLTAVNLLATHLRPENADELLRAAARKSKSQLRKLIAERFPGSEILPLVETIPASTPVPRFATTESSADHVKALPCQPALARVAPRSKVEPLATQRFVLQLSMDQEMHDDLRCIQELLSHQLPSGDITEVVRRSFKTMRGILEKRKFAATDKPSKSRRRESSNPRYVPAEVRRAVMQRDGGQCTFKSDKGRRCSARRFLEFDHVLAFARGGRSTVDNLRLRCRAHNQYTAECTFGTEFMKRQREAEPRAAANSRARTDETKRAEAAAKERAAEVIPYLLRLGIRASEARLAAERCASIPDAPLEERVRLALGSRCAKPLPPLAGAAPS